MPCAASRCSISFWTQTDCADAGDISRMKWFDASSARWMLGHRPGSADMAASSRKTRVARSRYQGLARRCSASRMLGATSSSARWL